MSVRLPGLVFRRRPSSAATSHYEEPRATGANGEHPHNCFPPLTWCQWWDVPDVEVEEDGASDGTEHAKNRANSLLIVGYASEKKQAAAGADHGPRCDD